MENENRIRKIQAHPLFRELCEKLREAEQNRIFCRHTMEHFLDVARLMYIYSLEDGANLPKDLIYAAALLHDLGRLEQLTGGRPHEVAGADVAEEILRDCGFEAPEIRAVQAAILAHRNPESSGEDRLGSYLYRADKGARSCYLCSARELCNWPEEKKNLWITY